jgi:hypothetical protein
MKNSRDAEKAFGLNNAWTSALSSMQWNKMLETGGYKGFRMAQTPVYYFWTNLCISDTQCRDVFCKGRRTRFTEMALDHSWCFTCTRNAKIGIIKSDQDAASVYLENTLM